MDWRLLDLVARAGRGLRRTRSHRSLPSANGMVAEMKGQHKGNENV